MSFGVALESRAVEAWHLRQAAVLLFAGSEGIPTVSTRTAASRSRAVPAQPVRGQGYALLLGSNDSPLTSRGREVARVIDRGQRNSQICQLLVITTKTAKNHVQHALGNLIVRSPTAVAASSHDLGARP